MFILNFLWYCIKCLFVSTLALTGNLPKDFTWKDGLTAFVTFLVIVLIITIIIILIKKKTSKR